MDLRTVSCIVGLVTCGYGINIYLRECILNKIKDWILTGEGDIPDIPDWAVYPIVDSYGLMNKFFNDNLDTIDDDDFQIYKEYVDRYKAIFRHINMIRVVRGNGFIKIAPSQLTERILEEIRKKERESSSIQSSEQDTDTGNIQSGSGEQCKDLEVTPSTEHHTNTYQNTTNDSDLSNEKQSEVIDQGELSEKVITQQTSIQEDDTDDNFESGLT